MSTSWNNKIHKAIFALCLLIASASGQLPMLMPKDDGPPPNPFGESNPGPTTPVYRPTPPPLDLSPGPNPNPNPVPVQPATPPPFNPPTPPPLPTPPPIGGPGSAPAQPPPNQNNPFDKLGAKGDATANQPASNANAPAQSKLVKPTGKQSRDPSNRLSGDGWPRVPRSSMLLPRSAVASDSLSKLWELVRRKRQDIGQAVAAAKTASAAGQAAKGASSLAGSPVGAVPKGGSGLPGAGSLPGGGGGLLEAVPSSGGVPGTGGIPGAGGDSGGIPSGGSPSISTFPDTDGDIVMPENGTPKPTTPRFMLPRQLELIKANPEALQQLLQIG